MSAIERFKNRKNRSLQFEISFPPETKELIFKVNRFSSAEMKAARDLAIGAIKKQGIEEDSEDFRSKIGFEYAYFLADIIKKHITSWEHKPEREEDKIPFSKGALESLFQELSADERIQIGAAYFIALSEDEEKKTEA